MNAEELLKWARYTESSYAKYHLRFHRKTEEAFHFYRSIFEGKFEKDIKPIEQIEYKIKAGTYLVHLIGHDYLESSLGKKDDLPSFETGRPIYLKYSKSSSMESVYSKLVCGGIAIQAPITLNKIGIKGKEGAEMMALCQDRFGVDWLIQSKGRLGKGGVDMLDLGRYQEHE